MIIKILRYIIGFVIFKASGGFCERFINLCEDENIPLWNIENKNGEITASTTVGGYKRIRKASKNSGMKTKILKKTGLRFIITQNKMRSGLALGAIAFLLILITLSQFAWRIEIVGNVEIEDETILSVFEEYGVKTGAKISDLDLGEITENVLERVPDISWATVNKKGSVMCIEVREKRKIPELYDASVPTNVVASEDGLILSSDVLRGTEEVKIGSAVRKGDLLISGIVVHRDGTEELLHADGYVRAKTQDNFNISTQNLTVYSMNLQKKRSEIFFFGVRIPLGLSFDGDIVNSSVSYLQSGDAVMPVGLIKTIGFTFSDETDIPNEMQKFICLFKCAEHIYKLTDNAEVKESKITVTETETDYSCNVYSTCEKNIAELKEIYTEKTKDKN